VQWCLEIESQSNPTNGQARGMLGGLSVWGEALDQVVLKRGKKGDSEDQNKPAVVHLEWHPIMSFVHEKRRQCRVWREKRNCRQRGGKGERMGREGELDASVSRRSAPVQLLHVGRPFCKSGNRRKGRVNGRRKSLQKEDY